MASALCSSSELINLPCWFNSFELSSETSVCFSPKQVVVLYLTSSQNGSQLMKIDALKLFFLLQNYESTAAIFKVHLKFKVQIFLLPHENAS